MKNDKMKSQYRINEQIRVREVRIVGDEGSSVVPTRDALNMAREGDEGQAGKGGGEGNPLRTSDR